KQNRYFKKEVVTNYCHNLFFGLSKIICLTRRKVGKDLNNIGSYPIKVSERSSSKRSQSTKVKIDHFLNAK
ncbi:hypothetical protein, partial [Enterococcus faecium]|uniref:hypothetical protein n=1 Tax=Enterococcus faecium TaxID=1352 RepID=UPI002AFE0D82